MKIGILGGTFDPIHYGHLIIAELACDELQLDRVLFVLSPLPPHKSEAAISPVRERLNMLTLALQGNSRFELSTIELERAGKSYTIDTVSQLKSQSRFKDCSLYFIIGMDNLVDFHKWRSPAKLLELCNIAVYPRKGYSIAGAKPEYREACTLLDLPLIDLASSTIRRRCSENKSIRYLVPDIVRDYIRKHSLYL